MASPKPQTPFKVTGNVNTAIVSRYLDSELTARSTLTFRKEPHSRSVCVPARSRVQATPRTAGRVGQTPARIRGRSPRVCRAALGASLTLPAKEPLAPRVRKEGEDIDLTDAA